MAITIPTLDALTQQIIAYFRVEFPTRDLGSASWLGKQARAMALAILQLYQGIDDAAKDSIPSATNSTLRLDEFAILFGLANGAGGYGRKGAAIATGGEGPLAYDGAGPFPYTLTAGATLTDGAGYVYELAANVVWGAAGTETATVDAVTPGAGGNLGADSVLTFSPSPPAGVAANITLSTGLSGGLDVESDAALFARLLDRLQNPPKGGVAADYRAWCESQTSVSTAYVYPRRLGTGTVDVVITQSGSGIYGVARGYTGSTTVRDAVQAYIDSVRSVTVESATVMIPTMSADESCRVRARVIPAADRWDFDWDDTGGAWEVDTVTVGPPYKIKLDTLADATLKAAITAGAKPRIQSFSTSAGSFGLPIELTCIAWADAGGKTELTIETAPEIDPTVGEPVYASSDVVVPVAQAILDYSATLGPSKYSGFYDDGVPWDDTLRVDRIIQTALDVFDGSTRMIRDFAVDPTISVNGGAFAATNETPSDAGTSPPGMLYLTRIAVTQ